MLAPIEFLHNVAVGEFEQVALRYLSVECVQREFAAKVEVGGEALETVDELVFSFFLFDDEDRWYWLPEYEGFDES